MALAALVLALTSAVLHALWNMLLGGARNVEAAAAVTFMASVVIAAPIAVATWDADRGVWPYALASTLLELAYVALLAFAYRTTDVSVVYPLTRGLAPVLALGFAVVALDASTSWAETAGVAVVGCGIVLVRGPRGGGDFRGLLTAAAIAAAIAGYTLVDRSGIRHASTVAYFELSLLAPCLVYPALVARFAGAGALRRELTPAVLVAAVANVGSFVCALAALRLASAASVLAVRSMSVVLATVLAGHLLREEVSPARVAGSVLVFGGIVLLATG